MRRARALLTATLLCTAWWACTDGPTASGTAVGLGIAPSFQVDPSLFASSPVDRIRLTAYHATTGEVVGSLDEPVSPTAAQWALSLGIDLGDAASLQILVDAELLSGSTVVWSGRLGPITVPTSAPALALNVYRGPLDNLDVLTLDVPGAPAQLVAGSSVSLDAVLTLVPGSDASPVVFWASVDPSVATVTPSGSTATLTAVAQGTTEIFAAAGSADFEFTLQVLPPGSASKTWAGGAAGGMALWSLADNWTPAGVPTSTDDVLIPATANDPVLDVPATVDDLTVASGATLDVGQMSFQVLGGLDVDGTVVNGEVEVGASTGLLEGNLPGLHVAGNRTVSGTLTLTDDLTVAANLSVASQTVTVGGSLSTVSPSGRVVMGSALGALLVGGDASFAGASQAGGLTSGLLEVSGDFLVSGSDPQSFVSSASHVVRLDGTAPQTIDFDQSGAPASRFNTLLLDGAGVTVTSDVYASGGVTLTGNLTVGLGLRFDIAGTLTLEAGSTLDVDGTVTAASCVVDIGAVVLGAGTHPCGGSQVYTRVWVGGDTGGSPTDWDNPANWNPPGVAGSNDTVLVNAPTNQPVLSTSTLVASITVGDQSSVDISTFNFQVSHDVDAGTTGFLNGTVIVQGQGTVLEGSFDRLQISVDRALSGPTWVNGRLLTVEDLHLGGQPLLAYDSLLVSGANGRLVMDGVGDILYVGGDAVFDGGDHTGALTAGTVSLDGDLIVSSASPTGFAASGAHLVSFDGVNPQSVTFTQPGAAQQRLAELWITNSSGVSFDTDAHATGDLDVFGRMEVPAGSTVTVEGDVTLSSLAELHVDGTLMVMGTCINQGGALITGVGTQPCGSGPAATRTWTGASSTSWSEPDNWSPVGVPQANDTVLVQGAASSPVLDGDVSIAAITVGGVNAVDLNAFTMTVESDVTAAGSGIHSGLVVVSGVGSFLTGFMEDLEIQADRTASGQILVLGDLTLSGELDLANGFHSVSGDLSVVGPNGRLVMTLGPTLTVAGDALFNGADHTGALTNGSLQIGGSFHATNASNTSFVASGSHVVSFYGSGPRTVLFEIPGPSSQRFNTVQISSPDGLSFLSDAYVAGSVTSTGHWTIPSFTTTTVAGTVTIDSGVLEVQASATLIAELGCSVFNGLVIGSGMQPCGTPVQADFTWTGASSTSWSEPDNWSPVGVPTATDAVLVLASNNSPALTQHETIGDLTVAGGAVLDLGFLTLTVNGDVNVLGFTANGLIEVAGAGSILSGNMDDLIIAAPRAASGNIFLDGSLDVQDQLAIGPNIVIAQEVFVQGGSGFLVLDDADGGLVAQGDATFGGQGSDLRAGQLYLYGDWQVTAPMTSGATVYLDGSSEQTISFSDPGPGGGQHNVAQMWVYNSGGPVTFATNAFVTGNLYAYSTTLAGPGTTQLQVGGSVTLDLVTFDGLPLRIVSNTQPNASYLNQITFTGMLPGVSQLYVDLPGVTGVPLVLNGPIFETVPTGGGYYIEAVNPLGVGGPVLEIQLNSPLPATSGGYTKTAGSVQIVW